MLVRVVIIDMADPANPIGRTVGRSTSVSVDGEQLFLISDQIARSPNPSTIMGISLPVPASDAHRYVDNARFARSQACETDPVVIADRFGALNLLRMQDHPLLRSNIPDLKHAQELMDCASGRELLDTLRVYLRCGSLRAAADTIFLHHSSIAHRLAKLSQRLGYSVDSVENRARATAMMMVIDSIAGSPI